MARKSRGQPEKKTRTKAKKAKAKAAKRSTKPRKRARRRRELTLRERRELVGKARGILKGLVEGPSLVDELLAERRAAGELEDEHWRRAHSC